MAEDALVFVKGKEWLAEQQVTPDMRRFVQEMVQPALTSHVNER
jgi:hypothetical protein